MASQHPPKPPSDPGSIDFEETDFDSARQALDELPAGVEEVKHLQAGSWDKERRKPVATDRALTGLAMDWVIGLPPALRPHATCEQFPRVINAMAAAWNNSAYGLQVIDHIINDYRGGRRGFPEAVQRELSALHAYRRTQLQG